MKSRSLETADRISHTTPLHDRKKLMKTHRFATARSTGSSQSAEHKCSTMTSTNTRPERDHSCTLPRVQRKENTMSFDHHQKANVLNGGPNAEQNLPCQLMSHTPHRIQVAPTGITTHKKVHNRAKNPQTPKIEQYHYDRAIYHHLNLGAKSPTHSEHPES